VLTQKRSARRLSVITDGRRSISAFPFFSLQGKFTVNNARVGTGLGASAGLGCEVHHVFFFAALENVAQVLQVRRHDDEKAQGAGRGDDLRTNEAKLV
jgi:hypothetical protein